MDLKIFQKLDSPPLDLDPTKIFDHYVAKIFIKPLKFKPYPSHANFFFFSENFIS